MNKNYKTLKMNIKGRASKFLHKLYLKFSTHRHGLVTHSVHYEKDTINIVLEGDRKKLWNLINSHKRGNIFITIEEFTFQFEEIAVSAT